MPFQKLLALVAKLGIFDLADPTHCRLLLLHPVGKQVVLVFGDDRGKSFSIFFISTLAWSKWRVSAFGGMSTPRGTTFGREDRAWM